MTSITNAGEGVVDINEFLCGLEETHVGGALHPMAGTKTSRRAQVECGHLDRSHAGRESPLWAALSRQANDGGQCPGWGSPDKKPPTRGRGPFLIFRSRRESARGAREALPPAARGACHLEVAPKVGHSLAARRRVATPHRVGSQQSAQSGIRFARGQ